jgi:nucleoside phosphorylase
MKILIITPIHPEYKICGQILELRRRDRIDGFAIQTGTVGGHELVAVKSGPGALRAARAVCALISREPPQLILDTGSCAGIAGDAHIGRIIIADACAEYEGSAGSLAFKNTAEPMIQCAYDFLKQDVKKTLLADAVRLGGHAGYRVTVGTQACGTHVISSTPIRRGLWELCHAAGGNWETAGVLAAALQSALPALSFRIVTDLGDAHALKDFFLNIKPCMRQLYGYLKILLNNGWVDRFFGQWRQIDKTVLHKPPDSAHP